MGLNGGTMGLGFLIQARDLASGVIAAVERQVTSLDKTVSRSTENMSIRFDHLAGSIAVVAAGFAPLGAALATTRFSQDFKQGLAAVGAAAGATATQMKQLHDVALQAGIDTQFTPNDAVQGLIALATGGQTAEQAMRTLRPSLDLAAASLGELNVEQASSAIVGTLNSYAMSADMAASVTDKLVQTTMLTNFQAKDFAAGLARAAEAGNEYSQSLDDVLIGMGILRNRNIQADVASTALRNAMVRVNSDLQAQNLLMGAGVPLRDQYTGGLRSILDVISDFGAATKAMDPLALNPIVKQIFGEEGMPAFSAITNAAFTAVENGVATTYHGAEAIAALRRELEQSGGAASRFVARYNDTFKGRVQLLKGSVLGLLTVIGEAFEQALKPAVEAATGALNYFLAVLVEVPEPIKKIAAQVTLAIGALAAFAASAYAATIAARVLKVALISLRVPLTLITGFLGALGAPVLATAAIITASIGAVYAAYSAKLGGIGSLNNGSTGQGILLYWRGLRQVMEGGALRGDVLAGLNQTDNQGLKRIVIGSYQLLHALRSVWDGVKAGFKGVGDMLGPIFVALDTALGQLKESAMKVLGVIFPMTAQSSMRPWQLFGKVIGGVLAAITAAFAALVVAVAGALKFVVNVVGYVVERLAMIATVAGQILEMVADAMPGIADSVATAFTSAFDVVKEAGQALYDWMTGIFEGLATVIGDGLRGATHVLTSLGLGDASPAAVAGHPVTPAAALSTLHATPAAAETRERTRWLQEVAPRAKASDVSGALQAPVAVAVQIDGETIARAVARTNRQDAARRFTQLPGL